MSMTNVQRQIRTLKVAEQCVALGARMRVTMMITGLNRRDLLKLFADQKEFAIGGRPPTSAEWIFSANLISHVESSMFAGLFTTMLDVSNTPGEALVAAYRVFKDSRATPVRISFDRAYVLACHLHGLWSEPERTLSIAHCPVCSLGTLTVLGDTRLATSGCAFCSLIERYPLESRLRDPFPNHQANSWHFPKAWDELRELFTMPHEHV